MQALHERSYIGWVMRRQAAQERSGPGTVVLPVAWFLLPGLQQGFAALRGTEPRVVQTHTRPLQRA